MIAVVKEKKVSVRAIEKQGGLASTEEKAGCRMRCVEMYGLLGAVPWGFHRHGCVPGGWHLGQSGTPNRYKSGRATEFAVSI